MAPQATAFRSKFGLGFYRVMVGDPALCGHLLLNTTNNPQVCICFILINMTDKL